MLSNIEQNLVKTVWHKKFFDVIKSNISSEAYTKMVRELNELIDQKIEQREIVVAGFLPGSNWSGTAWEPIYLNGCKYDEECSAKFFGLLVCQVLIDRPETWYFIRQDVAKSMIYFIPENQYKKENISEEEKKLILLEKLTNEFVNR